MSIGFSLRSTEAKTQRDAAAGLVFPVIEPWIPEWLDRALESYQPPPRRCDLLCPLRMLRFELLHATRPEASFRETLREVWQAWSQAGVVHESLPSPSALTQARARLPAWALQALLKHTAAAAEEAGTGSAWPDHRLLSIDGTPLIVPNTPANRTHFGATRHQHGEAYFPQALAVWVSRVHPQTVVAEYLGTSHAGDETVAPVLLPTVVRPGDLVLGDAHFGHYPTLWTVSARQAFYLVREPGPLHIEDHITAQHTAEDVDARLTLTDYIRRRYPLLPLPDHMDLRALRYALPTRDALNAVEQTWFLTNLPRDPYSHARLAALPPLRWNHETLNNDIKTRLGLGDLRSLTPGGAHAEVRAHLCLSNIVRLTLWKLRPEAPLRGSFTAALSAIREANHQLRMAPDHHPLIIATLGRMILDQPLDLRPDRTEPRMTRPRRRPYPIFKTARAEWREQRKVG